MKRSARGFHKFGIRLEMCAWYELSSMQMTGHLGSVLQFGYRGGLICRYHLQVCEHPERAHPRYGIQTRQSYLIQRLLSIPMVISIFSSIPGGPKQQRLTDIERRNMAEAFFRRLAKEGLSNQQLFACIMQDPEAFEHAVSIRKLHELIPELNAFEENLQDKDPNIYRPMPVMRHMLESIRQTFGWVHSFGAKSI